MNEGENENMDARAENETDLPQAKLPPKKVPAKSKEELRTEFKRDIRKIRRKFLILVCVCLVMLIGYGVYHVATTNICEAARNGKNWVIRIHLLLGTDINATDEFSLTPLEFAIFHGQEETVRFLLEHGADPNLICHDQTPLHFVCRVGLSNETAQYNIACLLLEHGANVNARDEFNGQASLHKIMEENNLQLAKLLIENGADINALSTSFRTPLDHLPEREEYDKLRALMIKHGGTTFWKLPLTPKIKDLYLELLISPKDFYKTDRLIRGYPELAEIPDANTGMKFLHYCVYYNDSYTFSDLGNKENPWLRANGTDLMKLNVNVLDKDGRTPLDYAKEIGNQKVIDILKKAGAKTGDELKKEAATQDNADENDSE